MVSNATFKSSCALFKDNELLIGGKKGLYLFENGKYISLGYIDPLLKRSIVDMKTNYTGGLWLATMNDGVLYLKDKHILHFTKLEGLISNICTSLAIDDQNNVWVGTTDGISQLKHINETDGWKIKNFTKKNGFNSNEITKLFTRKDTLWVGTTSGLSHAVISEITASQPLCSVYIDSIKVNNKYINTDKKSFAYDENNFKFETAALTFVDQGNHLFRYRLIGLDTSWVETHAHELSFNRLPNGDFQLEVQAANPDRAWSHSAIYKFTIHKPFWFTWWFILIGVLLVLIIIYLIIIFTVKHITTKEKEKARINKLLAEYQLKALTSQMNPHFIFNAINSIQNFILLNDGDIAYNYLEKFSRLIRMVLNNSEKKEVTLQNELDAMELYIELEQLRFDNSFDYVCEIDTSIDANEIVIPPLIIQPYIENAIWHGLMPLDRKGRISLLITKQEDKLKIVLMDNGIGRKASNKITKKIKSESHQSMGTNLTSARIKLFGDDITNSIQIIDTFNDLDEATGTTVEILLPFIEKY
jgi:competence protein ComGC